MSNPKDIINVRNVEYGDAWASHGQLLKPIAHRIQKQLANYPPIFLPWHLIFNKLLRALTTPLKRDHWVDIQGYAQLVIDFIDGIEQELALQRAAKEVIAQKEKRSASARKGVATRRRNRSKKLSKET